MAAFLLIAPVLFLKGVTHVHTPTPEAACLYERGQWHYNQISEEGKKKAYEMLSQAIQADPKFIEPYTELPMLYVWQGVPGLHTDEERWQGTRAIADKLLGIEPQTRQGTRCFVLFSFLKA